MWKTFKEDVICVFDRDPAARHWFEVITTYPGLHALLIHRCAHFLWSHHLKWFARWLSFVSRWWTGVEIHPGAHIGRRFFIDHGMGVVIGETAEIGDDCTLYHGVTLGGTSWEKGKRHPTLGDNVVVGAGAKVLGPITLGKNCRIGSNAVVLKDVPENATAVGIPAHFILQDDISKRRRRQASKLGFDAYGVTKDAPDPVAHAINCLLDHTHAIDEKIVQLCSAMHKVDAQVDVPPLSTISPCALDESTTSNPDTDPDSGSGRSNT